MAINTDYLTYAKDFFIDSINAHPNETYNMSFMFRVSYGVEKLLVDKIKEHDPRAEEDAARTAQIVVHQILLGLHKQLNNPPPNLVEDHDCSIECIGKGSSNGN